MVKKIKKIFIGFIFIFPTCNFLKTKISKKFFDNMDVVNEIGIYLNSRKKPCNLCGEKGILDQKGLCTKCLLNSQKEESCKLCGEKDILNHTKLCTKCFLNSQKESCKLCGEKDFLYPDKQCQKCYIESRKKQCRICKKLEILQNGICHFCECKIKNQFLSYTII